MINATTHIQTDLVSESRKRRFRSLVLLGGLLVLLFAFPAATGLRDLSLRTLAVMVNGLVLLLIAGAPSYSSSIRTTADESGIWLFAILLLPFLAADAAVDRTTPFVAAAVACFLSVSSIGVLALFMIRIGLGPLRKRFGGGRELQGIASALIGILAIALHCPFENALHLLSHVAAAALVSTILCRLALP